MHATAEITLYEDGGRAYRNFPVEAVVNVRSLSLDSDALPRAIARTCTAASLVHAECRGGCPRELVSGMRCSTDTPLTIIKDSSSVCSSC